VLRKGKPTLANACMRKREEQKVEVEVQEPEIPFCTRSRNESQTSQSS
jgi:hypothetical protein